VLHANEIVNGSISYARPGHRNLRQGVINIESDIDEDTIKMDGYSRVPCDSGGNSLVAGANCPLYIVRA